MVVRFGGTLAAMLAAPALAQWAGSVPLLLICGAIPVLLAAAGLARHWQDGVAAA